MENAYGIGVKNRYELFYDEDVDPLEIIRQQEEEKERRKTDKAKDKNKSTKAAKQSSSSVPKKAKENAPTLVSKPTEVIEPLSKPRNRAFGEKNKNTSSFEDTKDNEERKNFRNREDQYFNPDSGGTFTVRNSAYKRGNQESRDSRPDGEFRRGRGGFRGRGRGRGRGNFSNFDGRPRREFDRHSGSDKTGVRSTEKRDGGGANNWGDVKDDFKFNEKDTSNSWDDNRDDFEQTVEKKDPGANDTWAEITDDFDASTNAQPEVEKSGEEAGTENVESKENEPAVDADAIEEAVKEMTLDEWKREQESKRSVPKYNLRKPGEGEDSSQWKKLYVLKKKIKDEDDDEEEEEDEDVSDEEYGRRGRHRQVVDIPINFSDSRRSRGRGRGGRGAGPRGGGGGGGGVGGAGSGGGGFPSGGPGSRDRGMSRGTPKIKPTQQSAPKVDDWNDFPSLVTA